MMLGQILKGKDMEESVRKAMTVVRRMIELNLGSEDKYKGILVESCLEVIDS